MIIFASVQFVLIIFNLLWYIFFSIFLNSFTKLRYMTLVRFVTSEYFSIKEEHRIVWKNYCFNFLYNSVLCWHKNKVLFIWSIFLQTITELFSINFSSRYSCILFHINVEFKNVKVFCVKFCVVFVDLNGFYSSSSSFWYVT